MPCKACIFDLDGTLLDTLADLALACNTIMARHGWPAHETEKYRLFVGKGFARLMERVVPASVLPTLAPEELDALVREAKDFYAAHLWEQTMPYEGIPDALQDLAARGIRLGLLSNKPDSETQLLARHFFPDRFDAVAGSRPGVPLKPDPAALYAMLATLSVSPDETVYVGDKMIKHPYSVVFDETNPYYERGAGYNLIFVRNVQDAANRKLRKKGYLFLNDVYDMLGVPNTYIGQFAGWVWDPANPQIDSYVDFGLYDEMNPQKVAFLQGDEYSVVLDFNVDGNIIDKVEGIEKRRQEIMGN